MKLGGKHSLSFSQEDLSAKMPTKRPELCPTQSEQRGTHSIAGRELEKTELPPRRPRAA